MTYLIIAFVLLIPMAWLFAREIDPEDGFEWVMTMLGACFGAAAWPLSILLAIMIYSVKGLNKLSRGSRLQITWRNK